MRSQYVGPWRGQMRALERNILKYRSLQIMLVIFYADKLKRKVVDSVRATNHWRSIGGVAKGAFAKGVKDEVRKAFAMLVTHEVLTQAEADEIRALIDFRNTIAHELHTLVADLSQETIARDHIDFSPGYKPYDYQAVERLQHFDRMVSQRFQIHSFAISFSLSPMVFRPSERALLLEIGRQKRKVENLYRERCRQVDALNKELDLTETGLIDRNHPQHPLSQYDDGRLTARGVEICYRLFDLGRSVTAVAYLTGLSLEAARSRHTRWAGLGGAGRPPVDLDALPERKFYARYDD